MGAALQWSIVISLFLIVSHGLSMASSQVTCPEGFNNINDRCFKFVIDEPTTWLGAEDRCQSWGGYLSVLDSCTLLKEVVKRINAQGMQDLNFWIGATDIVEEDTWLWLSGAPVEMGMPFWGGQSGTPEPNGDHTSNCAFLNQGSRHYMSDGSCGDIGSFLCQVDANQAPPSDSITGQASHRASCPNGYTNISDRCFQFVMDEGMDWYTAQDKCELLGGFLAVLNDCDLLKDVVRRINTLGMNTYNFWTGATDIAEEDNWLWLSGDSVEMGMPFWGFEDSGATQPSGANTYDCAYLESNNRHYMHDASCTSGRARAICQVDAIILS